MMKGGTVSLYEVDQLRRVGNIVRLGHVRRIEADRLVLEHGSIPTTPAHLHVHCAAPGLSDSPPRPIFTDDEITLQVVTRVSLTLSGALAGFLEASGRSTADKNHLCPPTAWPDTPFDYLRVVLDGIRAEMRWQDAPDLREFVDGSRLNLLAGLERHPDRATVGELQGRFLSALLPALDKLRAFAADATPRERARMSVA
jgi:hypothetical protein